MPRIDLDSIAQRNDTGYPGAHARLVQQRWVRRLAPVAGLSDFGVSHVVLKPGAASSQRHWHEDEDEFLVMLSGEAMLVEEGARTLLRAEVGTAVRVAAIASTLALSMEVNEFAHA